MTAAAEQTLTPAEVEARIAQAVDAAVAAATAPLQARLAEHEGAAAEAERQAAIDAAVTEAVTPLKEQVDDLTAKLDDATVQLNAEKERADGLEQLIADEVAKAEAAAQLAACRTERIAQAKEVAGFTDEQLAEAVADGVTRADRFAAMTEEAWLARVDGWKEARPPSNKPPASSALVASAAEGISTTSPDQSAARKLAAHRLGRVAPLGSLVGR